MSEEVESEVSTDMSSNGETDTQIEYLTKVKEVECVLVNSLIESDAKWSLFVTAAYSYDCEIAVKPFLPEFITSMDQLYDIIWKTPNLKLLRSYIQEIDYSYCKKEVIILLHWILISSNSPKLEMIKNPDFVEFLTHIQDGGPITVPTFAFKISYDDDNEENVNFENKSAEYGSRTAFYTCDPYFLYKLLCHGFGYNNSEDPIRLTNVISIALSKSRRTPCWGKSCCGQVLRSVGVVEYIQNGRFIQHRLRTNPDRVDIYVEIPRLVRVRYILYYAEQLPHIPDSIKDVIKSKTFRRNYILQFGCVVTLAGVGCCLCIKRLGYSFKIKDVFIFAYKSVGFSRIKW
ncbi:protein mono-ADP-ribosyltransferase Parp16-like [Teleopsis dalmanni]|uniref:protein mono-ADP-ribosyltransferase Parp16-like n=1 Tax=Teleopsis dalmanni TaxID=139649 RepID=UPI0018CFD8B6|nr:protein mono-ADP-ribosyltransferase Parp16-like [Teleopsis dalmanni]